MAEKEKLELYNLMAECDSIRASGQLKAEAKAKLEKKEIEGTSEITLSELGAEAQQIGEKSELKMIEQKIEFEMTK